MVAEAETIGEGETIGSVRQRYGVGRTCMYESRRRAREALEPRQPGPDRHRREVERLQQENKRLREENQKLSEQVAETQAKLSRSVEVTPFRIVATALLILLSPVSTRRAHVILAAAFGERFAPADNTLSRWVLTYGRLARKIMAESAAAALIRFLAADEIYFHGQPVLCAVEPRTMAIAALERSPDSQGDSWEIVLSDFPNLELVASDMGKGLLAGIDRMDAASQVDLLHFSWLWPDVGKILAKRAEEALEWEDHYRDHVYDPHCPGRKPRKNLAEAEAETARCLDDWEAFLTARELFYQAMSPFDANHCLATKHSQLGLIDSATDLLRTIQAPQSGAKKLSKSLKKYRTRLVAFTSALWDIEVRVREGSKWHKKRVIAALGFYQGLVYALNKARNQGMKKHLCSLLPRACALRAEAFKHCENVHEVEAKLEQEVNNPLRSSSPAECINSITRKLEVILNQVNQPLLHLTALEHNLTPFERSEKRKGRSPYEMLGVCIEGDENGFLGVLLPRAQREGMLK
jgi:transposase-like protein